MDWRNVGRTLVAALIVVIGALLPMMTESWWQSTGVSPVWSVVLGTVALGVAAWWRKQEFEPDNPANLIRTLMQGGVVVIGIVLGLVSAPLLMSLGVPGEAAATVGGAAGLALAAWWRARYPDAFNF